MNQDKQRKRRSLSLSGVEMMRTAQERAQPLSSHSSERIGESGFQIKVVVEDRTFDVIIDENETVEELARVIEEVHEELYPTERKLMCCLLLDEDAVPLEFKDITKDALQDGALVYAVSTDPAETPSSTFYKTPQGSESVNSFDTIGSIDSLRRKNLDKEFKSLLYNTLGLQYFKEFCVVEFCIENLLFWLDVETFRYCEDPHISLSIAQRILFNYISNEGPLQINLGSDIRQKIPDPPPVDVSKEIFDEAQLHVYSMMKGHTFRRFLKSPKYEEFQIYILENPIHYSQAKILNPPEFFSKTPESENFDYEKALIRADSWSPEQRDRTLTHHMKRYWKIGDEPKTYYEDKNKLTTQQKLRRMRREKRLVKFFGDKPVVPQTPPKEFAMVERPRLDSNENSPNKEADQSQGQSQIFVRKKRAEKLEGFFGGKLPNEQLQDQKLVTRKPEPVPLNELEDIKDETRVPPTLNYLTAEDRKTLNKRSQKLQHILGDPIGENFTPITPTTSNSNAAAYLSLPRKISNYPKTLRDWRGGDKNNSEQKKKNVEEQLYSTISYSNQREGSVFYSRSESLDSIEKILKKHGEQDISKKKDYRRRKLTKLQSFLGEKLSLSLQQRQNIVRGPEKIPLSAEEKKQQQKKMYKLEKVFGEMPPRDMLLNENDPWKVRQQKSLHVLNYLLDKNNEDEINELVQTMIQFEYDEEEAEEDEDEKQRAKTLRQKKLNKLSHFFGNTLSEKILLEQKILSDLQQTIAEDVASDDELKDLVLEVAELQERISKRASLQSNQASIRSSKSMGSLRSADVQKNE